MSWVENFLKSNIRVAGVGGVGWGEGGRETSIRDLET